MTTAFRKIVIPTVFAGLSVPAAFAQSADNPFERGRYTAVTERWQPDFDPEPIRAGSFDVAASLGLSGGYNDNIFFESEDAESDTIVSVRPDIVARSDWSSHALTAGAAVDHKEYLSNDSESSTDYNAFIDGRLDVQRGLELIGNINTGHTTEPRYQPGNDDDGEQAEYDTLGAGIGVRFRRDRIQIEGRAKTFEQDFNTLYDFRDVTENSLFGRASYAISPDVAVFVQGEQSEQDYEETVGDPSRDGSRTNVQVGASFELQAPFRGEIAIGSVEEDKDDPVWADTSGFSVDGRVFWFPTQITTVTFRANQGVSDPGIRDAPSAKNASYGVRVDHELRRNIVIFGDAAYGKYDYEGIDREDEYTAFQAGLAYKINKRMHADISYRLNNQESNGVDADPVRRSVDQNVIAVGLKFYP
jgi:hypothetical protein